MIGARALLLLTAMSAAWSCMVPDITLDDAKCDSAARCIEGYVCDPATRRCVAENECSCVEAPPETWQGPFYLVTTTTGTDVGPCPGGDTPVVLHRDPPTESGCFECACGEADGSCAPAALRCRESDCGIGDIVQAPPGQCTQFLVNVIECRLEGDGSYEGSCQAHQMGDATLPGWQTDLTVCELTADARCGAGLCENPALEAQICILQEGDIDSCPAPWSERSVGYRSTEDNRACTACSCAPATAGCGPGVYALYASGEQCQTFDELTIISSNVCSDTIMGVEYVRGFGDDTPEDPHCEALGGVLEGSFVPQDPVTLCCLPAQ